MAGYLEKGGSKLQERWQVTRRKVPVNSERGITSHTFTHSCANLIDKCKFCGGSMVVLWWFYGGSM